MLLLYYLTLGVAYIIYKRSKDRVVISRYYFKIYLVVITYLLNQRHFANYSKRLYSYRPSSYRLGLLDNIYKLHSNNYI